MCKPLLIVGILLFGSQLFAHGNVPSDSAKLIIRERAQTILAHLAAKKIEELVPFIHPETGVRFSPYGFLSKASRSFKKDDITTAWKNKQKLFWGLYNGSGKPIRRTFQEYYKRYVYDRDYKSSALIAYNVVQRTNMFANIFDIYPRCILVDYLFLATPEFEELDWRSLRLVFTEFQGEWYLVHIVHDEWTV